ncbi:NAD(P)H-nitrite reductase [Desulfosporosinus acidiphilus SJ4]|uniref:NAD(P)H-nitrite reductase n=1 Tax=Desulfosporosinus acidiphilus (strain DSM 22704 / JCM 16185 / SJ4) TaxID=646529 RepID=I4D1Y0_DESAJ|nr:FAD-dependent oxidoreductase [Desulfosporosinus acidiphilus]AFM39804.1 NAD(P)H-nitrite reductase [Desulfosporosinus acidiphilus SJ4]
MNYVVVGNSTAAIGTVEGIRSADTKGKITLISDESYHTYSRPLISYYLSGTLPVTKMYYRPKDYYKRLDIIPRLGERVSSLRLEDKSVVLESGETIPYDRLMLATGGKPIVPEMSGCDLRGVHTFVKWDDILGLEKVLKPGKRVLVIGAGLTGLKAAEALIKCGVEVTVVELANQVLNSILDEPAAALVQKTLEDHGIKFYLQTRVKEILGRKGRVSGIAFQDGTTLKCEQVVLALGVNPNIDLVNDTQIQVNRGILVNEHMATSVMDVYAAGNVAEGYDTIYRQWRVFPLLANAYKQGFNAGLNMSGLVRSYSGSFAMNSIGFFDLPMITAGILKPEGEGFTELIDTTIPRDYRKLVLREGRIVGYIALNKVESAGTISALMEKEIDVREFQEQLLKEDFDPVNYLKQVKNKTKE